MARDQQGSIYSYTVKVSHHKALHKDVSSGDQLDRIISLHKKL